MEQGCWRRGGGREGVPPPRGVSPAQAGLTTAARMGGGTGMPVAGGGGRCCPTSPLRVTTLGPGPAVRPPGWDRVSLSPPCDADSTAGQILLEHLPGCDTGQGHLYATLQERDPMSTAPRWLGWGLRPLSTLRGVPASPPRHTQTFCTPQRAPTCCKHRPKP